MTLAELKDQFIGEWEGTNLLRFEQDAPDRVTPSDLRVASVVGNKFLSFAYTWSFNGAPHEGLMILGYDNDQQQATASWVDTWHQSTKALMSEGVIHDKGEVDVKGYYGTPGEPLWGWRTTIKSTEKGLLLEMFNCTPEGDEELAVRGDYSRKGR